MAVAVVSRKTVDGIEIVKKFQVARNANGTRGNKAFVWWETPKKVLVEIEPCEHRALMVVPTMEPHHLGEGFCKGFQEKRAEPTTDAADLLLDETDTDR